VDLAIWNVVEAQTGIIAACIPCLKSPCERVLRRFGLLSTCTESNCSDAKHRRGHDIDLSSVQYDRESLESVHRIAGTDLARSGQGILGGKGRRSVTANQWDTDIVEKTWMKGFET
jgi:hypothetical protein